MLLRSEPIRILMLLHHFPPAETIAAQRARRIVRHLPSLGFEPVVLTQEAVGTSQGWAPGSATTTEIVDGNEVEVIRVGGFDPVGRFQRRSARKSAGSGPRASGPTSGKTWKSLLRSLLIPDELIMNVRPLSRAGSAVPRVDLIYSTSQPYSLHLAAGRIARRLQIPWILEMRDLWTDNPYQIQTQRRWSNAINRRYEASALEIAKRIVVTTEAHAGHIRNSFGPSLSKRLVVIPNAFEERSDPGSRSRSGPLRLFHAGNFYAGRNLHALGRAVDDLSGDVPHFGNVELEIAGNSYDLPWNEAIGGPSEHHRILGVLGHDRVKELYGEVHAGVLHNPSWDRWHIPGKLFEYLGAGLPVLDLTIQPEIERICEGTAPYFRAPDGDREAIRAAVLELAQWWQANPNGVPLPGPEHPYSSRSQAENLSEVFRSALKSDLAGG